ncbi:THO complex subunit 4B-like [Octopus sinensis]|uniref:THO complex subunit 4B-like n=1 Tax=Octopus sinensis TaxID=2607531 RepID=A0A6P7TSP6_9MOLL|nr:THO complex subunit 4B-like [Octopus sinensis]
MSSGLRRTTANPMDMDLESVIQSKRGRFGGLRRGNYRGRQTFNSASWRMPPINSNKTIPGQLVVKNLHYGVSEDDLNTLFSEIGEVIRVEIHFDRAGRSLGEANVFFSDPSSVDYAVRKYDNVPLDGSQSS